MLAKKIALGFGLAIVFPALIYYAVNIYSPVPKWEDYYKDDYYATYQKATPAEQKKIDEERVSKEEKRKAKQKEFEKNLFFVSVPAGAIAVTVGALLQLPAIGAGLMFGGIFTICEGYWNYWRDLSNILRLFPSLILFVLLLCVGYFTIDKKPS